MQVVPDPEFDDPAAWSFVGVGASVTGGQLRFINPAIASSDTIPHITANIGESYPYSFDLSAAVGGFITARILFGGVEIYNNSMVLGTHSGDVVPINNNGLIFLMTGAGQRVFDRITIGVDPPPPRKKRGWTKAQAEKHKQYAKKIEAFRDQQIDASLERMYPRDPTIIRYL